MKHCFKIIVRGWRDGSAVQITGCSSRGLRFDSQNPYGGSQLSVTLVSGDQTDCSGFLGHQASTWCSDIHTDKTFIHTYIHSKSKENCTQSCGDMALSFSEPRDDDASSFVNFLTCCIQSQLYNPTTSSFSRTQTCLIHHNFKIIILLIIGPYNWSFPIISTSKSFNYMPLSTRKYLVWQCMTYKGKK